MALRESIARRAHSSVERKVAGARGPSASAASCGSEVTPPWEEPPNGWSGDRRASSVIGLCFREARRSRNGPPARTPWRASTCAGAGSGAGVRARAAGPVSRDGPPGARAASGDIPRARVAAPTRQPAAADSSATTSHTPEPSRDTRTARAPTDAPTPHAPVPLLVSRPTCLPSCRLDSHRPRPTHLITAHLICLTRSPAAAPPEATPASRLGWPVQVYLDRRGRGVRREAADPPSSKSPGGKPRKHPKAGRRPVALMGETQRAKQMEGNTRRETGVPSASACLIPGASFTLLDHSTCDGAFDRMLAGRPGARVAQ
jgi:hypothetical protein